MRALHRVRSKQRRHGGLGMGYQRAGQGRAGRVGYDKGEVGVSASALLVSDFYVFEMWRLSFCLDIHLEAY